MVAYASTTQPEGLYYMGACHTSCSGFPASTAGSSSLAGCALLRHSPKVEAECPNGPARFCAGGRTVMCVPTAITHRSRNITRSGHMTALAVSRP
jgi:hypothetical protein